MIVLLNDPFGIGKTTTARALVPLLLETMLDDPQPIGAFVGPVGYPGPKRRSAARAIPSA